MSSKKLIAIFAVAVTCVTPASAQQRLEGEWTAHFLTPGGEIASANYAVSRSGSSYEAIMAFGGGRVRLSEYRMEGNLLTFSMDPGFEMDCRLERQSERRYAGSCKDSRGFVGPALIAPPGVSVEPKDIDYDEAFKVWGISREEYMREKYPEEGQETDLLEPEPLPARSVDVGGISLNVVELGTGSATVVLESGVGDDHQVWRQIQKAVAERTRVVSYDRAGLGRSQKSSAPRSPDDLARELRAMLDAAGISPPYVLVGHEAGAFTVRRFSAVYPEEVAGIVLVDPAHEELDDRWADLDSASWHEYVERRRAFLSMLSDVASSEFAAFNEALSAESLSSPPSGVPTVIISGQKPADSPRWIGETVQGLKAKEALHRHLAHELNADIVLSTRSGGNVHMEDPEVVVGAIVKILDAVQK